MIYQSICCFKKSPNNNHTEEENLRSRHDQFIKDLKKFSKEIDVINLISSIKELKYSVNDIYSEIKKIKSQETIEPQAVDNSLNGNVTKKMKLESSDFDPLQFQVTKKNSINRRPKVNGLNKLNSSAKNSIVKRPEGEIKEEKSEENFDSEIASDCSKVNIYGSILF